MAGYASLALLAWIGFVPGSLPEFFSRFMWGNPVVVLITAAISLFILVILAPVFRQGPARERWLAALLAVFPLAAFCLTGLLMGSVALYALMFNP